MEIKETHFPILYSTNTWALQNAFLLERDKLTIVSAEEQSAGRGRNKSRWLSPKGENLYASFCFFCDEKKDVSNTPQILSLSIIELLKEHGVIAKIKWPNDILVRKNKIAGILSETKQIGKERFICLGVGLNINMEKDALETIDRPATSLYLESGKKFLISDIKTALAHNFEKKISQFLEKGFIPFYESFKSNSLLAEDIFFKDSQGHLWKGREGHINVDGSLRLNLEDGSQKTFFSGDLMIERQNCAACSGP